MSNRFATFFSKVESFFVKLFGSTKWESTVVSVITYVAPLIETIVQLSAGTGAAAAVTEILDTIKSDLATVAAVVSGAQVAPGSSEATVVKTALASVKSNLGELLNVAEVKNSAKIAEITTTVNLVVNEVDAMIGSIPATA